MKLPLLPQKPSTPVWRYIFALLLGCVLIFHFAYNNEDPVGTGTRMESTKAQSSSTPKSQPKATPSKQSGSTQQTSGSANLFPEPAKCKSAALCKDCAKTGPPKKGYTVEQAKKDMPKQKVALALVSSRRLLSVGGRPRWAPGGTGTAPNGVTWRDFLVGIPGLAFRRVRVFTVPSGHSVVYFMNESVVNGFTHQSGADDMDLMAEALTRRVQGALPAGTGTVYIYGQGTAGSQCITSDDENGTPQLTGAFLIWVTLCQLGLNTSANAVLAVCNGANIVNDFATHFHGTPLAFGGSMFGFSEQVSVDPQDPHGQFRWRIGAGMTSESSGQPIMNVIRRYN